MKRILIVEDETDIRDFIVINLKRAGFEPIEAETGEEALKIVQTERNINVILLDIMLPGIDGFEVLKRTRKINPSIGVIMLSAKSQEFDKLLGLTNGADDYIVKPFSPAELIARIDALLRRICAPINNEDKQLVYETLKLDLEARRFFKGDKEIELSHTEFQLIELFFRKIGTALSRDEILNTVWGNDFFGDTKIVDVNISRLRQKIESDPSLPEYINTIRGYGYRLGKEN